MPEPKRPLKVFLCHASTDKPKVRELYRYLKKRGIQPWFDEEDLVGGQDWQVEIPKALATSDAIIICLTKNSVDKEGYIQKEIKFALDKALEMPEGRIFLIPVKFEECEVPFTLSRYQWVDLTVESGYAKMMKALKFRASQLERSTVEVFKKDIEEENLVLEKKERETTENAQRERKEKEAREKQVHETSENEKRTKEKKGVNHVPVKPKAGGQIAYWFGGFIVLILGIIFLSSLNNPPSTTEPTPENTQTQTVATLAQDTADPSVTASPKSTSTPTSTPTPTSLPTEITDLKGVIMRLVPAGEFTMGGSSEEAFDICSKYHNSCETSWYSEQEPEHQVYLDAYYIDQFEVTNGSYEDCVKDGVCSPPRKYSSSTVKNYYANSSYQHYPVVNVDWYQAELYCIWRDGYLPTEAQWEKAARGVDGRNYPWGNEPLDCSRANYAPCKGDTKQVGSYENGKSPYEIYDMSGNVWEWVADWYSETYYGISEYLNPLGPDDGKGKVRRGGHWGWEGYELATTYRHWTGIDPNNYDYEVGFRCARDVSP